jgi:Ca2+-binding RTX toxin-like protein
VTTLVAGLAGNDTITLVLAQDEANAAEGNDSITVAGSGSKNNTISAGQGNDSLFVATGNSTFGGNVNLNEGADRFVNSGNVQLVSLGINGNQDNDTITFAGGALNSTIGGGSGNDSIAFTAGNVTNSLVFGGDGADTVTLAGAGTVTLTTIQSGDGHDRILGTALDGSNSLVIAAGAGFDSIVLGTAAVVASVAGGGLNDTISFGGDFFGGQVFGDGIGVTTEGTGTGGGADGNDLIGSTASEILSAASIYGAGGDDTVRWLAISGVSLLDGGNGNDAIGGTALVVNATLTGQTTLTGGVGNDTIRLASSNTAQNSFLALGGDGVDSVYIGGTGSGSVNGGSGNDTINFTISAANFAASALSTINGGDGADRVLFGSFTAGGTDAGASTAGITLAAVKGNYAYVSGQSDVINFNSTAATTASNWSFNNQVFVATGSTFSGLATAADQIVAGITGVGSVFVYANGTDLVLGITSDVNASLYSITNIIGGAAAINTTATGRVTLNASNFDFTISGSTSSGITVTFT